MAFVSAGTTTSTNFEILDIAPGKYNFRIRAVNTVGARSAWATTTHDIAGLLAKPAAVTGLALTAISSIAVLTWNPVTDLDVKIGGRIEIRHSSLTGGATWADSVSIGNGNALNGTATFASLPLLPGTYLIRAVDSSGVKSDVASVTTDAGTALDFTTLSTIEEHPLFLGVKTDTVVDSDTLRLVGDVEMDSWLDVDAIINFNIGSGPVDTGGSYLFNTGFDAGSVKRVKLTRKVTSTLAQPLDKIDSRILNIDLWQDFDGTDAAAGDCKVYVRHTDDDPAGSPTWSAWELLVSNEYNHRGFEFKAELSTSDPSYNIRVSELSVTAAEIT